MFKKISPSTLFKREGLNISHGFVAGFQAAKIKQYKDLLTFEHRMVTMPLTTVEETVIEYKWFKREYE